jgi:hypothetical protein
MSGAFTVRDAELPGEVDGILALNNAAVPAVNGLGATDLLELARMGAVRVAVDGAELLGAVVTLGPGRPYDSLNYAWFVERYDDFLYIDRVVVAPAARGRGVGRLLYEDVIGQARREQRPRVASEVNVDPPNPVSHAFHARLGFEPVAERLNEREGKVVAMMVRPV